MEREDAVPVIDQDGDAACQLSFKLASVRDQDHRLGKDGVALGRQARNCWPQAGGVGGPGS